MIRTALRWLFLISIFTALVSVVATGQSPAPTIYWDPNTESDVDGYYAYESATPCTVADPRPADCPNFARIGQKVPQGPPPIAFDPPGFLAYAVPIYYRVTAENSSGFESGFSNELEVTVFNTVPPVPPGDLRESPASANIFIIEGGENQITIVYNVGVGAPGGSNLRGQP